MTIPASPHTAASPLDLTGEILTQRAWRMPDMIIYRHKPEEWWLAPLDDDLPVIRLNRMGIELLNAMDGTATVGWLLERFGKWVCGPDGALGRWHLEHWAQPRYSLCYYGKEGPTGHRSDARWDLLLQRVREGWSGRHGFEGAAHLEGFHRHDIDTETDHFDLIETTVSHLFREPSEALQGLTYGRLLAKRLRRLGWWNPKPRVVVEVGGGLGYVSRELAGDFLPFERSGVTYTFLDLTRPFLPSQLRLSREAGWRSVGTQGNAERLPFKDASVDLVIDNENLADMTPVQLSKDELLSGRSAEPLHQEALDWIKRLRLPLDADLPDSVIFNLGPLRFLHELWRVLKPGGHAVLIEFGIEQGWPEPVKLPGHTEYEVQYQHMRHAAKWLGFGEDYCALPQFMAIKPDTKVLCTGAAYTIQRYCKLQGKSFAVRAYTEPELAKALGGMKDQLLGCHYHDVIDPAWFGLWDFKVLLLTKPGATPRAAFQETQGYRWYSQR